MRSINAQQKILYADYEKQGSTRYFDRYQKYLSQFKNRSTLRILDIGGASGYFAMLLKDYFKAAQVEIYVLDITEYDTWHQDEFRKEIHFICDSVENLKSLFQEDTFDIIFANRVFHHFINATWKKTLLGMENCMVALRQLLRGDGALLIMDHFYNGQLWDSSSSFLIYHFTSIRSPLLSKFIKKFGAATAGVGVCFQSQKMWVNRLQKCGFTIKKIEHAQCDRLSILKRIGLLCKSVSRNNIIFATPAHKANHKQ